MTAQPKTLLFVKRTLILGSALAVLVSCAPAGRGSDASSAKAGDEKPTVAATRDTENDAEILADEGERILSTQNMPASLAKFNEALQLNPKNTRADLWAAILKVHLEMKGLMGRIRPLIEAQPDGQVRYRRLLGTVMNISEPERRSFFLAGRGDITTTAEFQEWVDRLNLRLEEAREAIDRHKSEEVRLLMPRDFLGEYIHMTDPLGASRCKSISYGPIESESDTCDESKIAVLFNRADFEIVNGGLSMWEAELALLNAYRIDPASIAKIQDADNTTGFLAWLNNAKALRPSQQLALSDKSTQAFALSMRYAMAHMNEFCPSGKISFNARPEHLISVGNCLESTDDELSRFSRMIDQIIAHQPVTFWIGHRDVIDLEPHRLFNQPLRDLSQLGLVESKGCGSLTVNMTPLKPYLGRGSTEEFIDDLTCEWSDLKRSTP